MTFENLKADLVTAMKNKDKNRKETLSMLIGDIKNVAIDKGCRDNITDDIVDSVILKSLKTAKEQIETCDKSRADLLDKYNNNYNILNEYAPKLLSADEIREIIGSRFSDVIATKNKGLIMKTIMPEFKGKADGKVVNQIISEFIK